MNLDILSYVSVSVSNLTFSLFCDEQRERESYQPYQKINQIATSVFAQNRNAAIIAIYITAQISKAIVKDVIVIALLMIVPVVATHDYDYETGLPYLSLCTSL